MSVHEVIHTVLFRLVWPYNKNIHIYLSVMDYVSVWETSTSSRPVINRRKKNKVFRRSCQKGKKMCAGKMHGCVDEWTQNIQATICALCKTYILNYHNQIIFMEMSGCLLEETCKELMRKWFFPPYLVFFPEFCTQQCTLSMASHYKSLCVNVKSQALSLMDTK